MHFKQFKRFALCELLLAIALIAVVSARAADLYTLTSVKTFTNFPSNFSPSGVSNATVTAHTWRSNAIPIRPGKGIGLASGYGQASNGTAFTYTHYFGLIYNRTNAVVATNFSWNITAPASTAYQRVYTNIPAIMVDNADFLFWWSSLNAGTNTLTNTTLIGLTSN